MTELDLAVKEDKSHPARFFLEAGGATVMEVGVVDSDYNNWAVVWAQSNGNGTFRCSPWNFMSCIRSVLLAEVKNESEIIAG